MSEALDHWLPDCERHARATGARPTPTPTRCGTRRRRIRLRRHAPARPAGRLAHPGRARRADLPRAVPRLPVHACSRRRRALLVSGLCGQIWTLARDYPRARRTPRRSRPGTSRGTVRVAFAHWVATLGDGRAELCSEARVQPVDTDRPAAPEGDLGGARPVRAPGRRGAARIGGPAGRQGSDLECAPRWSRTRCARGWMTRSGSRRRAACSPEAPGEALDRLAALSARLLGAAHAQVVADHRGAR